MEGYLGPAGPFPKAFSTFSVIFTTGAIGHPLSGGGHTEVVIEAIQRLVPVANTPAPEDAT